MLKVFFLTNSIPGRHLLLRHDLERVAGLDLVLVVVVGVEDVVAFGALDPLLQVAEEAAAVPLRKRESFNSEKI